MPPADPAPPTPTPSAVTRRDFVRASAAAGAVAALGPWVIGWDGRPRMNLYIWSNYLAPETIPDFERETGIHVVVDTYESNEEMAAKLLVGAQGYDVIVPSNYILPSLVESGLLMELPPGALTNARNIAPIFELPRSNPYPGYAVPYMWGTTGIAWRRDKVAQPPDTWGVFLDDTHAGRMTMMDDAREVFGSMLRYRGHSINSTEPALLEQARDDALTARPNLLAFVSAPVKGQIVAGDVWIAHMWSGEASNTKLEAPEVAYLIPREGSAIWTDHLAMPGNAPNVLEGLRFIDYILRPEVGARIAEATGYGCPNAAANALLPDPVPYPTEEELEQLEFARDLGPATELVDRLWTEVKAG